MRRTSVSLFAVAVIATACSTATPERSSFTIPPAETTTTTTTTEAPAASLPGRLVMVGADGRIATMRPDGSDAATVREPAVGVFVFQPQWSPQTGQLAWGEIGPDGPSVEIRDADGGSSIPTFTLPYYLFWAPDGTGLVSLYNGGRGGVEARYVDSLTGDSVVLGTATPYFFSWAPDSGRIATHTGTTTMNIVELDGTATRLGKASPLFQAPDWTPTGIYHLTTDGMARADDSGTIELLARVPGASFFSANRAGTRLAIQPVVSQQDGVQVALRQVPELTANVVSVLDLETGELQEVTTVPAAGFFWSPDGRSLGVIVDGNAEGEVKWLVWRDGVTTELASFAPPVSFVTNVLPFSAQYAASLNLWSPDSTALAFAGRIGTEEGIWVQPVDGSDAMLVGDGEWVAWSYE